jgi:hypothetical protein
MGILRFCSRESAGRGFASRSGSLLQLSPACAAVHPICNCRPPARRFTQFVIVARLRGGSPLALIPAHRQSIVARLRGGSRCHGGGIPHCFIVARLRGGSQQERRGGGVERIVARLRGGSLAAPVCRPGGCIVARLRGGSPGARPARGLPLIVARLRGGSPLPSCETINSSLRFLLLGRKNKIC